MSRDVREESAARHTSQRPVVVWTQYGGVEVKFVARQTLVSAPLVFRCGASGERLWGPEFGAF